VPTPYGRPPEGWAPPRSRHSVTGLRIVGHLPPLLVRLITGVAPWTASSSLTSSTLSRLSGATILVVGALGAFARFMIEVLVRHSHDAYGDLRKNLGRVILLGLEVLIIADIIRTIVVNQSVEAVVILGVIVLIRVILSVALEVEIDGMSHGTDGASLPTSPLPTSPEEPHFTGSSVSASEAPTSGVVSFQA
jgi:uncharacterized membrane protein